MVKKWAEFLPVVVFLIIILVGCTSPAGSSGPSGALGASGPSGAAGVSVTGATVDNSGHLILTLSSGATIDAGNVVGPAGSSGTSANTSASFADIVPKIEPSIVRIDVTTANGLDSGSGTIIDNRGYILTNAHVVSGAQTIKVTLSDGTTLNADVTAANTNEDMAIIKMNTSRTDFPVIPLGTSSDVRVGMDVMTAGFPLGTDLPGPASFTRGMVSALRDYNGSPYIQTDAVVNPGNSGGGLITLSGKMVGIPTAGLTPPTQDFENINLAIPIDKVVTFLKQNLK